MLWTRKDIKRTQKVSLSINGMFAYVGFSDGPLQVIDLLSGQTIEKLRGVSNCFESIDENYVFYDSKKYSIRNKLNQKIYEIEKESFSNLSTDISGNKIIISESGANVRLFNIIDNKQEWKHIPKPGSHYLSVCINDPYAYGICWPYQNGGDKELVQFNLKNGTIEKTKKIGNPIDVVFVPLKNIAITSDGRKISLCNMHEENIFSRNIF